jgi:hypothetical protein
MLIDYTRERPVFYATCLSYNACLGLESVGQSIALCKVGGRPWPLLPEEAGGVSGTFEDSKAPLSGWGPGYKCWRNLLI